MGAVDAERPDGEDVAVVGVRNGAVAVEHARNPLLRPVAAGQLRGARGQVGIRGIHSARQGAARATAPGRSAAPAAGQPPGACGCGYGDGRRAQRRRRLDLRAQRRSRGGRRRHTAGRRVIVGCGRQGLQVHAGFLGARLRAQQRGRSGRQRRAIAAVVPGGGKRQQRPRRVDHLRAAVLQLRVCLPRARAASGMGLARSRSLPTAGEPPPSARGGCNP